MLHQNAREYGRIILKYVLVMFVTTASVYMPLLLGALVAGAGGSAVAGARFSPVWNCPYLGKEVVGKYGLDANPSGSFNGSVVWLSYGPSTWPRLTATQGDVPPCWSGKHPCTWNQSLIWKNITVASNGGVPQAGDIELHKAAVAALVKQNIPNPAWAGYGIFDWEAWRASFDENDDGLSYSNYYSTLLVKQQHPDWTNETRISDEAKRQYNAGAKLFFTETLRMAKLLRPNGKFGFYEYPMAPLVELTWLWQEVGVMASSQYMRTANSTADSVNASITAVNLARAAAAAAGKHFVRPDILVYVWLWPSAKPVSAEQLTASIQAPAAMGADGVFLWGSSSDAHVSGYSDTITTFLKDTAGPLMEKCSADRAQCATALCSGHGRCSNYDAAHPERGCEPPEDATTVTCLCDAGWQGPTCGTKE